MQTVRTFCFWAALCASLTVTWTPSGLAEPSVSGQKLYETYCTQCHGMLGDGWGVNIRDMAVQPRDHTDKDDMAARTDAELFKAIKHGGKAVNKSVLMPNWDGNFTDAELRSLVEYLHELCQCGR